MAFNKENISIVVLDRISNGESLNSILDGSNKDLPNRKTFYEWLLEDNILSNRYARACEERAEKIFEEMLNIADDGSNDLMTVTKGDVSYDMENKEVTNRSKLRIDTRKWMLAKMHPKKYGDKLDVTSDNKPLEGTKIVYPKRKDGDTDQ